MRRVFYKKTYMFDAEWEFEEEHEKGKFNKLAPHQIIIIVLRKLEGVSLISDLNSPLRSKLKLSELKFEI
jgi:hypothetical protein